MFSINRASSNDGQRVGAIEKFTEAEPIADPPIARSTHSIIIIPPGERKTGSARTTEESSTAAGNAAVPSQAIDDAEDETAKLMFATSLIDTVFEAHVNAAVLSDST